ncbi:extensin family protein [Tropicimonas sp. TH_r6]|uniref:extensin-like domain-containing protein n=1 Tax=Tropicimonas sp. TH_r6 TaxID=3082085 RepID=UPI0029557144|nr:extensin family protein [Tropicimonas sp. TH_r6]MDV7143821.1 extensin family protein [Tropicimonas sp. TH_r6]
MTGQRRQTATRLVRLNALARVSFVSAVLFSAGISAAEAPSSSHRPLARPGSEPAEGSLELVAMAVPRTAQSSLPDVAQRVQITEAGVRVQIGAEIRPRPRAGVFTSETIPGDSAVQVARQVTRIHFGADLRPTPRPVHPLADYTVTLASAMAASAHGATVPKARPAGFAKLFQKRDRSSYSKTGSVCGVNAIKGTVQPSFGKPGSGCGISNPVKVTEVSGVRLSTAATIDCTTAKALNSWVQNGIKPAFGRKGGGVKEIKVVASYACRRRNNRPSGKLSEHAKGHAVDLGAVRLNDGTEVSVLKGWRSKTWSKAMRKVHKSACGPFGTVLGPNADRYHQDHFHVDTARYRSGTYCR